MASSRSQLARATAVVAAGTLGSRFLGFVRETSLAWYFGAQAQADAYVIAITIPLVLFVAVGNAITNIIVPTYMRTLSQRGPEAADREVSNAAVVLTAGILVITAAAWLGARWVVAAFAPGFRGAEAVLGVALTRVTMPTMLFLTWAAVAQAILNSRGHFSAPAFQGIGQNLLTIAAIVAGGVLNDVRIAVWGVLVGTATTICVQLPALRAVGFRFRPRFDLRDPVLRSMAHLAVPVLISSLAQQLGVVLDRSLASRIGQGMVAALNYSFRLEYLAYGTLGLAVSTVLYPMLAGHAGSQDMRRFKDALGRGLGLLNFITVPLTFELLFFRTPIIRVLFQHGVFDAKATQETAFALLFFSLGTVAVAWMDLLGRSFFALHDPRTPMLAGVAAVAVNVILMFALVGPLRQGGLALATASGWATAAIWMAAAIRRKIGPLGGRRMARKLSRMALSAVVAVIPVWWLFGRVVGDVRTASTVHVAAALLGAALASSGLYLALGRALHVEEVLYAGVFARSLLRRVRAVA